MRMSLTHFSIGATLAVLVLTSGCTKTDNEMLYCDPADESWTWLRRQGTMNINLERGLIYGGDTSSDIYPFASDHFAGFEAEFPLLLFSDSVDPSEFQDEIVVNDIVFRVTPVEGSFGDLWLIIAKPREEGGEKAPDKRSTVLYSIRDGVLSMSFVGFLGEDTMPINYVPCTRRTLRYDDLRSFADANE